MRLFSFSTEAEERKKKKNSFATGLSWLFLLFWRVTCRHWRIKPWQTGLQVMILALGVGLFFSMRLANKAALASFENFNGVITQHSDFQLRPTEKTLQQQGGLSTDLLRELRAKMGNFPVEIVPVIETVATLAKEEKNKEKKETPMASAIAAREATIGHQKPALFSNQLYQLLGLDLVALRNLRNIKQATEDPHQGESEVAGSRMSSDALKGLEGVFITAALAQKKQLRLGDALSLILEDQTMRLPIVGILPSLSGEAPPAERLLLVDIALLQRLTKKEGRLDRIEIFLPRSSDQQEEKKDTEPFLRERLRHLLEDIQRKSASTDQAWELIAPHDRRKSAEKMTAAFRMNLTILSFLGLLVGLYLIIQSLDGAVMQRRAEIALLRSLGVTPKVLEQAWLIEAFFLGLLGGIAGIILGWVGAQLAVGSLSKTFSALYYSRSVTHAPWDFGEMVIALIVGMMASLLAGWWPARQAAVTPPAEALREDQLYMGRRNSFSPQRFLGLGLLCFVSAAGATLLPPWQISAGVRFPLGGYLATLLLILGGSAFASWLLPLLGERLKRFSLGDSVRSCGLGQKMKAVWGSCLSSFWMLKLTATHLIFPTTRHRFASASLMSATLLAAGMMILIASFETTMQRWVDKSFQSDIYISSQAYESTSGRNQLQEATWRSILTDRAIADAQILEQHPVVIDGLTTMLLGADLSFIKRHQSLLWNGAPPPEAFFQQGKKEKKEVTPNSFESQSTPSLATLAVMNESFAERFHFKVGDQLNLPTLEGIKKIKVVGCFSDYGNERGVLLLDRSFLEKYYHDYRAVSLILDLGHNSSEASLGEVIRRLQERFPALSVLSNRSLRESILTIFHQTFAITYALELIGVTVAMIGLAMMLWSIFLDRFPEIRLLQALGVSKPSFFWMGAWEALLLAINGVGLGSFISLPLGAILIFIINKESFGWTLQWVIPWHLLLLLAGALLLLACLIGGAVPFLLICDKRKR